LPEARQEGAGPNCSRCVRSNGATVNKYSSRLNFERAKSTPKAAYGGKLRGTQERCGKQPVVRLLLWEIFRLLGVIKLFYHQIVRLTLRSEDVIHLPLDGTVEEAIEEEPAILEEQRQDSRASPASLPRTPRPHMSKEAEDRLRDGSSAQTNERDLKRKSREAR
jgi:hypothetical protein